jgi:hypothetical protein
MSNEELWNKTSQEPIAVEIRRRKWRWIGHTLRKPDRAIEKAALEWNPQGSGNVVAQKRPGGGRLRMKQWRWERPGVKLRGWLTTEPDGRVSLMPYAPVGATGTN